MGERKEIKLGEITTKIGSGSTPRGGSNNYKVSGIYLIRSQNVLDFSFTTSGLACIDEEQAEKLKGVIVKENDILFNITGDSVARCCIVPNQYLPARVNQHVAIIRPDESNNHKYLFYYLQYLKPELLINAEIGATRNAITKVMLENLEIVCPQLSEQKSIAAVLSSLDDKIDLLHRQNATLEAMAETLFRKWFVKDAKEEWEDGKLSDLVNIKYGKDHKKLLDGHIPVFGSGGLMRKAERSLYDLESVLIPRKGTLNNVMYLDEPFWTVDTMFFTEMKRPNVAKFVYHFLKEQDLASMNVGSAVPSMTTEILNNMELNIPTDLFFKDFEQAVSPLYKKMKINNNQIRTLTTLRDTLLPKLMSGEVRVEN